MKFENVENYLEHYGKKGMRWGVRGKKELSPKDLKKRKQNIKTAAVLAGVGLSIYGAHKAKKYYRDNDYFKFNALGKKILIVPNKRNIKVLSTVGTIAGIKVLGAATRYSIQKDINRSDKMGKKDYKKFKVSEKARKQKRNKVALKTVGAIGAGAVTIGAGVYAKNKLTNLSTVRSGLKTIPADRLQFLNDTVINVPQMLNKGL